jgi:hypothetical protein
MIEGARAIHIQPPSARVLGKLKKGMKCRVCPAMAGTGVDLEIHPERFNHIVRTFAKGKGVHIQLSPEEIAHNHAKGIWDSIKKFGNTINDKVIKPAGKVIVPIAKEAGKVLLPIAKDAGNALIDAGVKYAPELASGALTGLALATGQPELVPLAGMAGQYLGKAGGKALGDYAHKQVNQFDPYGTANAPPSRQTQAVNQYGLQALNAYTGQNLGNIQQANLGSALANLSLGQLENLVASKRKSMGVVAQNLYDYQGGQALSPYADAVPDFTSGHGLYAGGGPSRGMGLYGGAVRKQRPRREMSSIGIHGNLLGGSLPPALMSQPYSANFQFGSRLPPAYQKFSQSGMGMC